jgi:hypothetical protein
MLPFSTPTIVAPEITAASGSPIASRTVRANVASVPAGSGLIGWSAWASTTRSATDASCTVATARACRLATT